MQQQPSHDDENTKITSQNLTRCHQKESHNDHKMGEGDNHKPWQVVKSADENHEKLLAFFIQFAPTLLRN